MLSFEEASPLLEAIGMSYASEEILDVPQLARDLGRTEDAVFAQIEQLARGGWYSQTLKWTRPFSSTPENSTCTSEEP